MTKKLIGIVAWSTGDNSFGVTKPYLEYWSQFGQLSMILPGEEIKKELDLLVLPGGLDLLSTRYEEVPSFYAGQANPHLEWFDKVMLPQYIEAKIPIFGICRGFQSLGVHFGCKMVQHIWWDHGYSSSSRSSEVHKNLNALLPDNTNIKISINSLHHQGILFNNTLPEVIQQLVVNGKKVRNKETKELYFVGDNMLEAFKHQNLPIVAVQWHPEEIYDTFTYNWVNWLLEQKSIYKQEAENILN